MKKVIVLIDGQNLFYSLKNLKIGELDIKWDIFLSDLIDMDEELLRTYWFRPEKLQYGELNEYRMTEHIIWRDHKEDSGMYRDKSKIPAEIKAKAKAEFEKSKDWLNENNEMFKRQENKYLRICVDYDNVEVIKSGCVKINPFKRKWIGEKGVDVCLAVKMIEFCEKCDKVILISGDLDYTEAIQFVKNKFKTVHLVRFHKGHPPKNRNMSLAFAALADKVINIYQTDLDDKYLKKLAIPVGSPK